MMSCEEFSDRVTAYLEGRVPYGERVGMWMHSMICGHCRNYLRQMSELVTLMSKVDEEDSSVDPDQKDELMEAFRAANQSDDG